LENSIFNSYGFLALGDCVHFLDTENKGRYSFRIEKVNGADQWIGVVKTAINFFPATLPLVGASVMINAAWLIIGRAAHRLFMEVGFKPFLRWAKWQLAKSSWLSKLSRF
jgi:hypothetical protein